MNSFRKPEPNAKYEQYYLECARKCLNDCDELNANIFLDLAEDFRPESNSYMAAIAKDGIYGVIRYDAWEKSIYFALKRAEDLMHNREHDQTIDLNNPELRKACAESLLEYARSNISIIAEPMRFSDWYRIKAIEDLIRKYN